MKNVALLTALLGFGINGASGSFFGGDTWQDAGAARNDAGRACRGYDGNTRAFQGTFAPGETKSTFIQHSRTQGFDSV